MTVTPDVRKIVLPEKAPKAERDLWDGYLAEVPANPEIDTKGHLSVRMCNGPDRGREVWMNRVWLMELEPTPLEPDTKGEW